MKVCDYLRSMSFLDVGPRSLNYRNQRLVFHSYLSAYECKILLEAFVHREDEIVSVNSGLHAQHAQPYPQIFKNAHCLLLPFSKESFLRRITGARALSRWPGETLQTTPSKQFENSLIYSYVFSLKTYIVGTC